MGLRYCQVHPVLGFLGVLGVGWRMREVEGFLEGVGLTA